MRRSTTSNSKPNAKLASSAAKRGDYKPSRIDSVAAKRIPPVVLPQKNAAVPTRGTPAPFGAAPVLEATNATAGAPTHGFTNKEKEVLRGETDWLDDDILNKALKIAQDKAAKGRLVKLFDACAGSACARKGEDLRFMRSRSSSRMQVIPFCNSQHWIVCIFVNLGNKPDCLILDSKQEFSDISNPNSQMAQAVGSLIANVERAYETTIREHILEVPQQPNGDDCGCYVYYFVEKMMESYDRVVAGDYESIDWDYAIQARHHMRQTCIGDCAATNSATKPDADFATDVAANFATDFAVNSESDPTNSESDYATSSVSDITDSGSDYVNSDLVSGDLASSPALATNEPHPPPAATLDVPPEPELDAISSLETDNACARPQTDLIEVDDAIGIMKEICADVITEANERQPRHAVSDSSRNSHNAARLRAAIEPLIQGTIQSLIQASRDLKADKDARYKEQSEDHCRAVEAPADTASEFVHDVRRETGRYPGKKRKRDTEPVPEDSPVEIVDGFKRLLSHYLKVIKGNELLKGTHTDSISSFTAEVRSKHRCVLRSLSGGRTSGTVRGKITALALAVRKLIDALPAEKAQYTEQLEEYHRQLESRADVVAQNSRPAFNARKLRSSQFSDFPAVETSAVAADFERPQNDYAQMTYESKRVKRCDAASNGQQARDVVRAGRNLIDAPPDEDAQYREQLEEYQLEERADTVSKNAEAAQMANTMREPSEKTHGPEELARKRVQPAEPPLVDQTPVASSTVPKSARARGGTQIDKLRAELHDIKELKRPSMGIGANERVLLPSGASKMVKDLKVGDLVLSEIGKPVRVLRAPVIVKADGFEVTRINKGDQGNLLMRQQVKVAGLQPLEVTICQPQRKMDHPTNGSCVTQTCFELVASVRHGEWEVHKPILTQKRVKYSEDGTFPAKTRSEAEDLLRAEIQGNIPHVVRYYPPARDLVRYKAPEKDSSNRFYYAGVNLQLDIRKAMRLSAGFVLNSPEVGLSREREHMDSLVSHLSWDLQAFVFRMAGLWIGKGPMDSPSVVVNLIDVESMRIYTEGAVGLGLCCDVTCLYLSPAEREWFSGYRKGVQDVRISLCDSNGVLETGERELQMLHDIFTRRGRKGDRNRSHVLVTIFNGSNDAGRYDLTSGNVLWEVFKCMRLTRSEEHVKALPMWLATAPICWREELLTGLIESSGTRKNSDGYDVTTVYLKVGYLAVALGRSLGIPMELRRMSAAISGDALQQEYRIHFGACDALIRVASAVASPYKKPQKAVPGPEWVRELDRVSFTVTPENGCDDEYASGLEVEGHRFLMEDFMVMLDSNARELDTQRKTKEYLVERKCAARECPDEVRGCGPSWNNLEGGCAMYIAGATELAMSIALLVRMCPP